MWKLFLASALSIGAVLLTFTLYRDFATDGDWNGRHTPDGFYECSLPADTPYDGIDDSRARAYRRVFQIGFYEAWERHLACLPRYGPLTDRELKHTYMRGFTAGKSKGGTGSPREWRDFVDG